MAHACLESVPGKGDVCEGDDLAVALPNLKVLEQHNGRSWLESLPLELPTHDDLKDQSSAEQPEDTARVHAQCVRCFL